MTRAPWIFALCAAGFAAGAIYHAVGLVRPGLLVPAPPWRHALFIAINAGMAVGILVRPPFFVWIFGALTVQQLVSHSIRAFEIWSRERRVDWPSVAVVIGLPVVLALLVADVRAAAPAPPPR